MTLKIRNQEPEEFCEFQTLRVNPADEQHYIRCFLENAPESLKKSICLIKCKIHLEVYRSIPEIRELDITISKGPDGKPTINVEPTK